MNKTMTPADFVQAMYEDACWSNGPETMTEEDAAYNLDCYHTVDHLDIPARLTPRLFAAIWNLFYTRDVRQTWEVVQA